MSLAFNTLVANPTSAGFTPENSAFPPKATRRGLFSLAAVVGAVAIPAAASAPRSEVDTIFQQLNPERQDRMLLNLRDCLTAQRIIERERTA